MKKSILVIILSCAFSANYSQSDKLFYSLNFSLFSQQMTSSSQYEDQVTFASFFGGHFKTRYNLTEPSENFSIGINSELGLSFGVNEFVPNNASLAVNFPVFFNFNFGAGSTYNTPKSKGFSFGAGYEMNKLLIQTKRQERTTLWLQPMANMTYRWITKRDNLYNLSVSYGMGIEKSNSRTSSLTISLGKVLFY